ncbi:MAG: Na+/H+ antiporter subunit E [Lawsonibacter sp.]
MLLLFLFWMILNGKVTIEIVVVGAAVSAALAWTARRMLHISPQAELRFLRCLPGVFVYLLCLAGQVVRSNLQVIRLILSPRSGRPKLVWFAPPVKGDLARLALANSITLTPGTVTVALGKNTICVYALRPELAEGIKESGLTRRLNRLEGDDYG